MRTKVWVALCLAVFGATGTATAALPSDPRSIIDVEAECSTTATMVPQDYEIPVVGDYEKEVVLDVHVILVGIDQPAAERIMKRVAGVYEPIGVKVDATYEKVDLKIDPPPDTSATGTVLSTSESRAYIQASKDHFGGRRPWHADVVYTMLGGELASAVAGQADCVGGIAYPDAAFAVGEAEYGDEISEWYSAKIAAHEIAHLLAAHHHFANCAEGNRDDLAEHLTPCTLMFNDVFLISLGFSTLEAAVVRAYALEYADATPTSPPPPPKPIERTLTLSFDKKDRGAGVLSADTAEPRCTQVVPVLIERKTKDRGWVMEAELTTDGEARFRFTPGTSGTYRAAAPEIQLDNRDTCAPALSPSARRS